MNAVCYCRLSKDDNRSRYTSIEGQQQLAQEYAEKHSFTINNFYIDDDQTGFIEYEKRPNFYRMLQDVESGKIDLILAKDLSRLCRKNSRALNFVDIIKESKSNLILMSDPILGEFNLQTDDDSMLGLSTWFNERYVKEVSTKVKGGMQRLQKQGTLMQGTKFGYLKTSTKGELIVDERVRNTITTIFNLYEKGLGMRAITLELNSTYKFLTPSQIIAMDLQAKGRTYKKPVKDMWDIYMIKRILTDEIYIGTLITHKTECEDIHANPKKIPKENQLHFENHHEPIISKEQFKNVQEILALRKKSSAFYQKKSTNYALGGFLRCGSCKKGMTGMSRKRSKNPDYVPIKGYDCENYRKYGKSRCCSHYIKEDYLLANLKNFLKIVRDEYSETLQKLTLTNFKKSSHSKITTIEEQLEKVKFELQTLISQKINDLTIANEETKSIILETYSTLEKEKTKIISSLEEQIKILENEKIEDKENKLKQTIDYFTQIIESPTLDKSILNMLVDKIYIYPDKSIIVDLKVDIKNLL